MSKDDAIKERMRKDEGKEDEEEEEEKESKLGKQRFMNEVPFVSHNYHIN